MSASRVNEWYHRYGESETLPVAACTVCESVQVVLPVRKEATRFAIRDRQESIITADHHDKKLVAYTPPHNDQDHFLPFAMLPKTVGAYGNDDQDVRERVLSAFKRSVRTKSFHEVQQALHRGVPVNHPFLNDEHGRSCLMVAAIDNDDLAMVKLLLFHNADLKHRDHTGFSLRNQTHSLSSDMIILLDQVERAHLLTLPNLLAFLMGMHRRCGRESALWSTLYSSPLFDRNCLHMILSFFYTPFCTTLKRKCG